jgi:hypothetical protein
MNSERLIKGIYKWKPLGKRTAGRPNNTWQDDVMKDLMLFRIKDCTNCIQNREDWRRIVEKVKTFKELS